MGFLWKETMKDYSPYTHRHTHLHISMWNSWLLNPKPHSSTLSLSDELLYSWITTFLSSGTLLELGGCWISLVWVGCNSLLWKRSFIFKVIEEQELKTNYECPNTRRATHSSKQRHELVRSALPLTLFSFWLSDLCLVSPVLPRGVWKTAFWIQGCRKQLTGRTELPPRPWGWPDSLFLFHLAHPSTQHLICLPFFFFFLPNGKLYFVVKISLKG